MIVRLLVNYKKTKPNNPKRFTWSTQTVEYDMYDSREFLEDLYLSMLAFTEDVRAYHWRMYEQLSQSYYAREEKMESIEEMNEAYSKVQYHADRGFEGEILPRFYMHEGVSYEVENNLKTLEAELRRDDYSWMFSEKKTMSMPSTYFKGRYYDMSFKSPAYIPVKFNHWAEVDIAYAHTITQEIELATESRIILNAEGEEI